MGNQSSRKKAILADVEQGSSTDVDPRTRWSLSPFRRKASEPPIGDRSEVYDVPSKPGKAIVTLTNMQSDKPKGNCITDSIFLCWTPPSSDGGMPILGYNIEMYDLPTGDWVKVTVTEGLSCKSTLDNILCGIMYRFRVRAYSEMGCSVPGIPSDAFVIDTPGVHVAPYFIVCPPADIVKYAHDTVQLKTKALGTPKPNILWQKDDEPIFITDGIEVREEQDGSSLIVHNLQLADQGQIQCIAVNTIGKAEAKTNLQVLCRPQFTSDKNEELHFSFRKDEMIRLKFPFEARPSPQVMVKRNEVNVPSVGCGAYLRDNYVIFKIDTATGSHSGNYSLLMENDCGTDFITFDLYIEQPPDPPGTPEIEEVTEEGKLALSWTPPPTGQVDHYIVEYYRDQWQLWLRMKTCINPEMLVKDLIPGSRYKFRVMAACASGVSEPSQESESIMVGKAAEDELFDLPNTRNIPRPKERMNRMRKQTSFERSSLDGENDSSGPISQKRQVSLDREVYYDANNVRRDVVTYIPIETSKLGTVAKAYGLSQNDLTKYKDSLSNLASKLSSIVNINKTGSKMSLDMETKPLQMEVFNQARKSSSLCHLGKSSIEHIDMAVTDPFAPIRPARKKKSSSLASLACREICLSRNNENISGQFSNDVNQCRQSLTDIRGRIGSLQSLLQSASKQSGLSTHNPTFSDRPHFIIPLLPPYNKPEVPTNPPLTIYTDNTESKNTDKNNVAAKRSFISQRNDSYSRAIEDDPVSEYMDSKFQETHFPYDPEAVTEIECSRNDINDIIPNSKNSLLMTAVEPSLNTNQLQTTTHIKTVASYFLEEPDSQFATAESPRLSGSHISDLLAMDTSRSASACSTASSATVLADSSRSISDLSGASSVTVLALDVSNGTLLGSNDSRMVSALSSDTLQENGYDINSLNSSMESLI